MWVFEESASAYRLNLCVVFVVCWYLLFWCRWMRWIAPVWFLCLVKSFMSLIRLWWLLGHGCAVENFDLLNIWFSKAEFFYRFDENPITASNERISVLILNDHQIEEVVCTVCNSQVCASVCVFQSVLMHFFVVRVYVFMYLFVC